MSLEQIKTDLINNKILISKMTAREIKINIEERKRKKCFVYWILFFFKGKNFTDFISSFHIIITSCLGFDCDKLLHSSFYGAMFWMINKNSVDTPLFSIC